MSPACNSRMGMVRQPSTCRRVRLTLDWFNISICIRHIEQAMQGLKALDVQLWPPLDYIEINVERLRHLLRNGYRNKTHRLLASIVSMSSNLVLLDGPTVETKTWHFVQLREDFRTYIWSNRDG